MELGVRLNLGDKYQEGDFGRRFIVSSIDECRCVELSLETDSRGGVVVMMRMMRTQTACDHRSLQKYYPRAMDQAVSVLNKGGFQDTSGQLGEGRIDVRSALPFGSEVMRDEIEVVAEVIRNSLDKIAFRQ
jgi:hypothetical protein